MRQVKGGTSTPPGLFSRVPRFEVVRRQYAVSIAQDLRPPQNHARDRGIALLVGLGAALAGLHRASSEGRGSRPIAVDMWEPFLNAARKLVPNGLLE